jgi:translocation and assembly module TamA
VERYDLLELLFPNAQRELLLSRLTPEEIKVLIPDFGVPMPGVTWTYLETDNRVYSRRGYQVRLDMRAAHESLGASMSFWQTRLDFLAIQAIGASGGRIIARGNVGYTLADSVNIRNSGLYANVLPYEVQFRTGGDRSVRGYEFEELIGDNSLVGGKHLLVGSLEYEHRLRENWSAALFYDTGNALNSFEGLKLYQGAGVGARWHSPVGLVRIDLAAAIDKEGTPWRVHLTIGPDF